MIMPEFSNDYFILMGMKIRRYDSSEIHATQIALPFSFKLNVSTKNIFGVASCIVVKYFWSSIVYCRDMTWDIFQRQATCEFSSN